MRLSDDASVDLTAVTTGAGAGNDCQSASPRDQARSKPPRTSHAINADAFAASMDRLGPFEHRPFLAIAVSGGPDSLALTLLADHWARLRGGHVIGLTIDHGLRPNAAEEARQTGQWLQARQIGHACLTWSGDKPVTALQQRAREARYALLTDWCRRHHCLHLLTAHHRDDQAETVAMRADRQSGEAGLAGMAAVRDQPGLRLLRPLLGVDKADLEATLRSFGQPWLTDPSNSNPRFIRSRLRADGLDVPSLARTAQDYGQRRRKADQRAAEALVRYVRVDPAGFATLEPEALLRLPADRAKDLLARLLLTIGGGFYPPHRRALERLYRTLRRKTTEPGEAGSSGTLGHCRILDFRGRWLICRESTPSAGPRRQPDLPLQPGVPVCWDGRFVLALHKPADGFVVSALSQRQSLRDQILGLRGQRRALPGVVRAVLPAIWRDRQLAAIPHLGLFSSLLSSSDLDVRFCPLSPLANAAFKPHMSTERDV